MPRAVSGRGRNTIAYSGKDRATHDGLIQMTARIALCGCKASHTPRGTAAVVPSAQEGDIGGDVPQGVWSDEEGVQVPLP